MDVRVSTAYFPADLPTLVTIRKVAVIGAGTMGSGIAQVCAQTGWETSLFDAFPESLERGIERIQEFWDRGISKGKTTSQQKEKWTSNLIATSEMSEAVEGSEIVIEAVPEKMELKKSIFEELGVMAPSNAVLATNTSGLPISEIASHTSCPERVIGMHFMNPVPIMKLIEIINGSETDPEVTAAVLEASEKMGKVPLECNDSPGFVSNRILCPMLNEAILTLQEGVAEPEAIDGIMKLGMNHPIGPLALADLIGLDTVLHIMGVLHEGLGQEKYAPAPLLVEMVESGRLGRKSGSGFYEY